MPIASVFLFFSSLVFAQSAVNQEKIRLTIKNHLGEVRRCYNDGLKKTPDAKGKVVVDFEIDDHGRVIKSGVNESSTTLRDREIQSCITGKVVTWKFPPADKGKTVAVNYPFMLDHP